MKSQNQNNKTGHGKNHNDVNNTTNTHNNHNHNNSNKLKDTINEYPDIIVKRIDNRNRIKSSKSNSPKATIYDNNSAKFVGNERKTHRIPKKRLTNKQLITRIVIGFISVILILAVGLTILWNFMFSGMQVDVDNDFYPTEALTYQPPESKDITNILLLGVDARNPNKENGLSDSIIILTVDSKNGVIKMTSIMRDCYVYIPGHKSPNKINAAHSFGGPELAMRTINNTLRLNIKKYMVVNFFSMADIVDLAGGVTVSMTDKERIYVNKLLYGDFRSEYSSLMLTKSGTQKINGKQAVEFARIRKLDSDSERARRQRAVLSALFLSFKDVNPIKKAQLIKEGLSKIKTNMTPGEITSLGIDILPKMSSDIMQMRLPIEGMYKVNNVGVWYMNVDYNKTIPEVYKFIYGEEKPFDLVPTIPYESHSTTVKSNSISHDPEELIPTADLSSSTPNSSQSDISISSSESLSQNSEITSSESSSNVNSSVTSTITITPTATQAPTLTVAPTITPS